jgi:hypothetical protein
MKLKFGQLTLTLQWGNRDESSPPSPITADDLYENYDSDTNGDPELHAMTRAWAENAETNERITATAYRMGFEFCQELFGRSVITEEESSRFSAFFKK